MDPFPTTEAGPSSARPSNSSFIKIAGPSTYDAPAPSAPLPPSSSAKKSPTAPLPPPPPAARRGRKTQKAGPTTLGIADKFSNLVLRVQLHGPYGAAHASLTDVPSPPAFQVYDNFLNGKSAVLVVDPVQIDENGHWEKVVDGEKKVIKVKMLGEAKSAYDEYITTKRVYDTVLAQRKVEASLLPSQVGIIEEWVDGVWSPSQFVGMISPLHIPLLSFVQDNAKQPDLIILVMVKAALALEHIHACRIEHVDLKPRNIVVVKVKGEGALGEMDSYEPKYIDFEQTQFVDAGKRNTAIGGTLGYHSLSAFAMSIKKGYDEKEEAFNQRWDTHRSILDDMLLLATKGHTPADDRFALGSSFFEALMMCKRALGHTAGPSQLLDIPAQEKVLKNFDPSTKRIPSWAVIQEQLSEVAGDYRRVWDTKEYQGILKEGFSSFEKCFDVLEYLLQPTYFSEIFTSSDKFVARGQVYEALRDKVLENLSAATPSHQPTKPLDRRALAMNRPRDENDGRFVSRDYVPSTNILHSALHSLPLGGVGVHSSGGQQEPSSGEFSLPLGQPSKPYDRTSTTSLSPLSPKPKERPTHMSFKGISSWSGEEGVEVSVTPEGNKWVPQGEGKEPLFEIHIKAAEGDSTKAVARPWRHGVLSKSYRYVCGLVGCPGVTQDGYFGCRKIDGMQMHWKKNCKATNGVVPAYESIPETKS